MEHQKDFAPCIHLHKICKHIYTLVPLASLLPSLHNPSFYWCRCMQQGKIATIFFKKKESIKRKLPLLSLKERSADPDRRFQSRWVSLKSQLEALPTEQIIRIKEAMLATRVDYYIKALTCAKSPWKIHTCITSTLSAGQFQGQWRSQLQQSSGAQGIVN